MSLKIRLLAALERNAGNDPLILTGDSRSALEPSEAMVPAAVLIAVVDRSEPGVLLTVRNSSMRKHAGQIAFPGGRIDPEDSSPIAAALREAEEEIALPRQVVDVVGTMDMYETGTGYSITPVVGIVPPDLPLVRHDAEVADWFEAPLGFLLDGSNHIERTLDWQGAPRTYHEIVWNGRRIWGATAAMIVNLRRRIGVLI